MLKMEYSGGFWFTEKSVCVCVQVLYVQQGVEIHFERRRIRLGERVSVAGLYKRRNGGVIACGEVEKNGKAKGDKIKTVRLWLIRSCGLHRIARTRKG